MGDVCTSELGKTLNKAKDTGKLRPYLCSINVLWNTIDLTNVKEAQFEEADYNRYSVKKGDLLICEGGDIGRSAIWKEDYPMLYQNALHRVRFDGTILPMFCLYTLKHLKDNGIIDANYGKGVTIKHLVKSSLMSIVIPVPPLAEQERIVAELDLLTEIIDKQKAQLKELDTLAQSIFYDMFGDPVENEKGWEKKRIDEIGKVITGNTPSTKEASNYSSDDYCFVKPSDIARDTITYINNSEFHISQKGYECSRKLPKGTILTTCIGIIGKVGVLQLDATCNQQVNAIIPNVSMDSTYIAYTVFGFRRVLEAMANAPVVPIINKGDYSAIKIPVPLLSLQQSFADKINAIEQQKAAITQSIAETQKLFDYTMDKYFG